MKKKWIVCFLTAMFFMVMAAPAGANVQGGAFTISPMVGGYHFDSERPLKNWGWNFALGLGYNFTKHFAAEGTFNFIHTDSTRNSGNSNVYAYQPHLDFVYHITPDYQFVPYLTLGVGGIFFDDSKMDPYKVEDQVQASGGMGVKIFLNHNWALRADAKYYYGFEDNYDEFAVMAGIVYQIGGEEPVEEIAMTPCTDEDNDGVCDDVDQCLNTPPDAVVDSVGCDVKLSEPMPETPAEPMVEQPRMVAPKRMEVIVYFDFGKTAIKPEFYDPLADLAAFMQQNPTATAMVVSHTDSIGTIAYNNRLSVRRSKSVQNFLVSQHGIEAGRFELIGKGESEPAASNKTARGRALNRRAITISIVR